jgi:hypothetical protein
MNAARDLLQSMHDFGWPILAYAILAPLLTYILPSRRSRQERTGRLVFVGGILALIVVILFVGTASNEVVQVARVHRAWGAYVLLLALVPLCAGATWAVLRMRQGRIAISVTRTTAAESSSREIRIGAYLLAVAGVWLAGSVLAVVWLFQISNSG